MKWNVSRILNFSQRNKVLKLVILFQVILLFGCATRDVILFADNRPEDLGSYSEPKEEKRIASIKDVVLLYDRSFAAKSHYLEASDKSEGTTFSGELRLIVINLAGSKRTIDLTNTALMVGEKKLISEVQPVCATATCGTVDIGPGERKILTFNMTVNFSQIADLRKSSKEPFMVRFLVQGAETRFPFWIRSRPKVVLNEYIYQNKAQDQTVRRYCGGLAELWLVTTGGKAMLSVKLSAPDKWTWKLNGRDRVRIGQMTYGMTEELLAKESIEAEGSEPFIVRWDLGNSSLPNLQEINLPVAEGCSKDSI